MRPSEAAVARLKERKVAVSMSRPANPYDNAKAEKNLARLIDELHGALPGAIERTLAELPAIFPQELAASVAGAAKTRLGLLTVDKDGAT